MWHGIGTNAGTPEKRKRIHHKNCVVVRIKRCRGGVEEDAGMVGWWRTEAGNPRLRSGQSRRLAIVDKVQL